MLGLPLELDLYRDPFTFACSRPNPLSSGNSSHLLRQTLSVVAVTEQLLDTELEPPREIGSWGHSHNLQEPHPPQGFRVKAGKKSPHASSRGSLKSNHFKIHPESSIALNKDLPRREGSH